MRPGRGPGPALGVTSPDEGLACVCIPHRAQPVPPVDYKPLTLALGSAFAFGLGVAYVKGGDAVRARL
jgi:hypothetical protein